jgi:hypothetical protein
MRRRHARGGKVWASPPDDSIPAILHPAVVFTPDDPVLTHRQAWDMRYDMADDLWAEARKGRTRSGSPPAPPAPPPRTPHPAAAPPTPTPGHEMTPLTPSPVDPADPATTTPPGTTIRYHIDDHHTPILRARLDHDTQPGPLKAATP